MDIQLYSTNLNSKNGIWVTPDDEESISYPSDGNQACFQVEDNSFWFKHRNECIIHFVNKFHNKNKYFFDVGGGNGFVAKYLQEQGVDVCLLEPGTEGALNARDRGVKNIINATFESAKFKASSINSIGLFDVVEHIENDKEFLTDCYNHLEEAGKIFITVPAFNFLWSANDIIAGHFRRYTIKSISKVLASIGFKIEFSSYLFSPLTLPLLALRTIPTKLGFIKAENAREKTIKHHNSESKMNPILDNLLKSELKKIKSNKTISQGTSCLIIASK